MSIEVVIAENTAAIAAQTTAMNKLIEILSSKAAVAVSPSDAGSSAETKPVKTQKTEPAPAEKIYWRVTETGEFGELDTEAQFKKLKKEKPSAVKIPLSVFETLSAEDGATDEQKPLALLAVPTSVKELQETLGKFLDKALPDEKKTPRAAAAKSVIKALKLERLGTLPEEHWESVFEFLNKFLAAEEAGEDLSELVFEAQDDDDALV